MLFVLVFSFLFLEIFCVQNRIVEQIPEIYINTVEIITLPISSPSSLTLIRDSVFETIQFSPSLNSQAMATPMSFFRQTTIVSRMNITAEIESNGVKIFYELTLQNVVLSSFKLSFLVIDGSLIDQISLSYISLSHSSYPNLSLVSNNRSLLYPVSNSISALIGFVFLTGFQTEINTPLSFELYLNSPPSFVRFKFQKGTHFLQVSMYLLYVNENKLKMNRNGTIDFGNMIARQNGSFSSTYLDNQLKTHDFFFGICDISTSDDTISIDFSVDGEITIIQGQYKQISAIFVNFRISYCQSPNIFSISKTKCDIACPVYYYGDPEKVCQRCHYTCLTCSSENVCLTCDQNIAHRTLTIQNKCECQGEYYEFSGSYYCRRWCQNCDICEKGNQCKSCVSTPYTFYYKDKLYDSYYFLHPNQTCKLCIDLIYRCLNCTAFDTCTACITPNYTLTSSNLCSCNLDNNFILIGTDCLCNDRYYVNNFICQPCDYTCAGCEDEPRKCTSCLNNEYRELIGNQCKCIQGYFDNSESVCLKCMVTCKTCRNSNTCQTCDSSKNLTINSFNSLCECISPEYVLVINFCKLCVQLIPNCHKCQNYQICSQCISPNYTTTSDRKQCICQNSKDYFPSPVNHNCVFCIDLIHGCQKCSSSEVCEVCISPNFTKLSNQDSCFCNTDLQYVKNQMNCTLCSELINGCIKCSTSSKCDECNGDNFTTTNGGASCECNTEKGYFPYDKLCYQCNELIWGCQSCSSNVSCATCISPNYTKITINTNTQCKCQLSSSVQYLIWNQNCTLCRDIILGCLNCSNNQTCLVCDSSITSLGHWELVDNKCICANGYYLSEIECLPCDPSCLTCQREATNCLTCNHSAWRTLKNTSCQCIVPYSDCRFSSISECDPHTCSFLNNLQMKVQSIIKDPSSNSLILQIILIPQYEQMNNLNFSELISFDVPFNTEVNATFSNSKLKVYLKYYQNIKGEQCNMRLKPNNQSTPWYFRLTPQSSIKLQLIPTNNLASNVYSDSLYKQKEIFQIVVLTVISFGIFVFLLGMYSAKIIVSQMMGVIQLAYIGLFMVNQSDPLIYSLRNLRFINGLTQFIKSGKENTPIILDSVGFTSSTLSNINYTLVLLIIPPIISFIFYRIHVCSPKYRIRMEKAWKLTIGQYFFTVGIFVIYNYSSSMIATFMFSHHSGTIFYISCAEIVLVTGIIIFLICIFIMKNDGWMGQYKNSFNWNTFSQFYYLLPLSIRFVIGILLTSANSSFGSGIASMIPLIVCLAVVAKKKPFIQRSQNIRSIIVNVYGIVILGLYVALSIDSPSKGQSVLTYVPYVIVGIVLINIVTGFVFTIFSIIQKIKLSKIQLKDAVQFDHQQQMQLDMKKEIERINKESKNNSIFKKLVGKIKKTNNS